MSSGWGDTTDMSEAGGSVGPSRAQERTAWLLQTINDRKASEAFAALHYWVRAVRYEPTQGERELLERCERRAALYSGAGEVAGLLAAGLGARSLRLPRPHALAVTLTGALLGHIYAQFKCNQPALVDLLTYGAEARTRGVESELADQAERILEVGGRQAVRVLHRQLTEARQTAPEDGDTGRGVLRRGEAVRAGVDGRDATGGPAAAGTRGFYGDGRAPPLREVLGMGSGEEFGGAGRAGTTKAAFGSRGGVIPPADREWEGDQELADRAEGRHGVDLPLHDSRFLSTAGSSERGAGARRGPGGDPTGDDTGWGPAAEGHGGARARRPSSWEEVRNRHQAGQQAIAGGGFGGGGMDGAGAATGWGEFGAGDAGLPPPPPVPLRSLPLESRSHAAGLHGDRRTVTEGHRLGANGAERFQDEAAAPEVVDDGVSAHRPNSWEAVRARSQQQAGGSGAWRTVRETADAAASAGTLPGREAPARRLKKNAYGDDTFD